MDSAKEFETGKLTTTVAYNTFYTNSNVQPVSITFSIGATISGNDIIRLATLTDWKLILDLDKNKAFSKTIQRRFPLSFLDASPDLPLYSSYFSASYFVRPKQ